jgi:hypothetical protein
MLIANDGEDAAGRRIDARARFSIGCASAERTLGQGAVEMNKE